MFSRRSIRNQAEFAGPNHPFNLERDFKIASMRGDSASNIDDLASQFSDALHGSQARTNNNKYGIDPSEIMIET